MMEERWSNPVMEGGVKEDREYIALVRISKDCIIIKTLLGGIIIFKMQK